MSNASEFNVSWRSEAIEPSTSSYNCPLPAGPCPGIYRFVGNDPGIPGRLNTNYNPQFRTIAAEFEARLRELNPKLIYCSVTGFGQDGPYATRAGYDLMAQGMGGLMSITGDAEGKPMRYDGRWRDRDPATAPAGSTSSKGATPAGAAATTGTLTIVPSCGSSRTPHNDPRISYRV